MVRHECPECERDRAAGITGDATGERYVCLTCGIDVSAENVLSPPEALTDRDKRALGIEGADGDEAEGDEA